MGADALSVWQAALSEHLADPSALGLVLPLRQGGSVSVALRALMGDKVLALECALELERRGVNQAGDFTRLFSQVTSNRYLASFCAEVLFAAPIRLNELDVLVRSAISGR
jgi:hypothetical protein